MPRVLVTGGCGFVGSHVAECYADRGWNVRVLDNLSRASTFSGKLKPGLSNWSYLQTMPGVDLIRGDVRDGSLVANLVEGCELVVHCAGQTAVTTSLKNPRFDFENNVMGTFNVLEAARQCGRYPTVVFCSTNKVYGENVNLVPVREEASRYRFEGVYSAGINETFNVDGCEHTPYGTSKLTADLYAQEYSNHYGLRVGVFRMSCIYGPRQLGVEDQGWLAWFAIAAVTRKPVTIYGDGKQVRDVLYVTDLVEAFDRFVQSDWQHLVVNVGGGPANTLSLLELVSMLENFTGHSLEVLYDDWRPSDQKVYVSDIEKAKVALGWKPTIGPQDGVARLLGWVMEHRHWFDEEPLPVEVPVESVDAVV